MNEAEYYAMGARMAGMAMGQLMPLGQQLLFGPAPQVGGATVTMPAMPGMGAGPGNVWPNGPLGPMGSMPTVSYSPAPVGILPSLQGPLGPRAAAAGPAASPRSNPLANFGEGASAGASVGGLIGSIIPGIGTGIGAAAGGLVGGIVNFVRGIL